MTPQSARTSAASEQPDDSPLILLVEDELLIANALEMTLEMQGFRVLGPAPNVTQARALLQRQRPDLALIDYRLASGTTEPLLHDLEALSIPACVLTGYSHSQLPDAYAGYAVLQKPFPMAALVAMIRKLLAERE